MNPFICLFLCWSAILSFAVHAATFTLTAIPADAQVTLTWKEVPGAKAYGLCSAQEPIADIDLCTSYQGGGWINLNGRSHQFTKLVNDTSYSYRVVALSSHDILAVSNAVTVTPGKPRDQRIGQYIISADGQVVTDTKTGLIWRRCAEGMTYNSQRVACTGKQGVYRLGEARQRARQVADRTGKAWRMPTVDELRTLLDSTQASAPYINREVFPDTPPVYFWSSSPYEDSINGGWDIGFGNDRIDDDYSRNHFGAVRLVRNK
jgi:hypothetical protein